MSTPHSQGVHILCCATPNDFAQLKPSAALNMFRSATKQHQALLSLAAESKTCITIAIDGQKLIGYVAFHPPTEIESWGADHSGEIIELGAIEIDPEYRGQRLAQRLLKASFAAGRFDHTVVIATMYVWHYDLKRTDLSDFQYKRMLEKLYRSVGMSPFRTSDPEIRSNAANQLMARIGPNTPQAVLAEFERLRTQRPRYGVLL